MRKNDVPSVEAAQYAAWLLANGATYTSLSAATGLERYVIRRMVKNPLVRCQASTARYILGVRLEQVVVDVPDADPEIPRRQMGALRANGWFASDIGREIGVTPDRLRLRTRDLRLRSRASLIDYAYRTIGDRVGPSPRAAITARNDGYLPPIYCDSTGRIIPESIPGSEAARKADGGRYDVAARVRFACLGLLLDGYSQVDVSDRLGVNKRAADRAARQVGFSRDWPIAVREMCRDAIEHAETLPGCEVKHLWDALCVLVGETLAGDASEPQDARMAS